MKEWSGNMRLCSLTMFLSLIRRNCLFFNFLHMCSHSWPASSACLLSPFNCNKLDKVHVIMTFCLTNSLAFLQIPSRGECRLLKRGGGHSQICYHGWCVVSWDMYYHSVQSTQACKAISTLWVHPPRKFWLNLRAFLVINTLWCSCRHRYTKCFKM